MIVIIIKVQILTKTFTVRTANLKGAKELRGTLQQNIEFTFLFLE